MQMGCRGKFNGMNRSNSWQSGKCLWRQTQHSDFVKCLCLRTLSIGVSKTLPVLLSGSSDSSIRIWNAETGEMLCLLKGHRRSVESIAVDVAGTFVYSAGSDGTVRKWELSVSAEVGVSQKIQVSASAVAVWSGHETGVYSLILDEDEEALWSGKSYFEIFC